MSVEEVNWEHSHKLVPSPHILRQSRQGCFSVVLISGPFPGERLSTLDLTSFTWAVLSVFFLKLDISKSTLRHDLSETGSTVAQQGLLKKAVYTV